MNTTPILPPAMLGILGGGQLGRMFTVAAKTMGYRVTVLDPDPHAPAAEFADRHLCAAFDDPAALQELAQCAAITTEFENVNADAMRFLAQHTTVSPSGDYVAIAQNRIQEKAWIQKAGLQTAPYQAICQLNDITEASAQLLPGILKTATLGYDGKGQTYLYTQTDKARCQLHFPHPYVAEDICLFDKEISVAVCSFTDGIVVYEPFENVHVSGILRSSLYPARINQTVAEKAMHYASKLVKALNYRGILVVEFFVLNDEVYFNEFAPRPHNSAHGTIEACDFSQFDLHIRAITNHPKLEPKCLQNNLMLNILGEDYEHALQFWNTSVKPIHLHLYGKTEIRPQRKMGHLSFNADTMDECMNLLKQWSTR